jgi:O-antigen ligase
MKLWVEQAGWAAHALGRLSLVVFAFLVVTTPAGTASLFQLGPALTLTSSLRGEVRVGPVYLAAALGLVLWLGAIVALNKRPRFVPREAVVALGLMLTLSGFVLGRACCHLPWPDVLLIGAALTALLLVGSFTFLEVRQPRFALLFPLVVGCLQAGVGLGQFLLQRSLGLGWLGELGLDRSMSGISVVEAGGVRMLRAYGLTGHPNHLGGVLSLALLGAVGLWLIGVGPRRYLWLAPLTLITAGLVVSFSRAAWGGAAVGLSVLAICYGLANRGKLWRQRAAGLWPVLCVIALTVGLFVLWRPEMFRVRLTGSVAGTSPLEIGSVERRLNEVRIAWDVIRAHPLWGVGTGRFPVAASAISDWPAEYWLAVHNVPLWLWAEDGLGAVAAWLGLGVLVVGLGWRKQWHQTGNCAPIGVLVAMGWMVSIQTISLFDYYYLPTQGLQAPLWLGLTCGLWAAGFSPSSPACSDRPGGRVDSPG